MDSDHASAPERRLHVQHSWLSVSCRPDVAIDGRTLTDVALVEGTVQEETIEIRDGSFDPVRCTIEPGTAVVWRNADDTRRAIESVRFHDEVSDWQFRTQPVQPGGSVEYVFDEPGVYEYFCRQEGREASGAVLVGDVSLSEPLPGE